MLRYLNCGLYRIIHTPIKKIVNAIKFFQGQTWNILVLGHWVCTGLHQGIGPPLCQKDLH